MQLANELRSLSTEQFSDGSYTVIGLSAPLSTLADAPSAYEQARLAARVSARIPRFEGVAAWDELGVYRLLSVFPAEELRRQLIGGHLQRLIEADRAGTLVTTLETYLDLGGNIQATASTLVLHRASLYHRLDRIQEILEISLRDGEARLELHLSLKLARIAGLETARPSSRPPRPQARSASAGHD
jgi:DNA-binding PucR family transcriptional regulator